MKISKKLSSVSGVLSIRKGAPFLAIEKWRNEEGEAVED